MDNTCISCILFHWLKIVRGKADAVLFIFGLCLYSINRFLFKTLVKDIPILGFFFKNYFNDLLGGFCFIAFLNFVIVNEKGNCRAVLNIFYAGLIGLCCGLLWEYIFPFFFAKGTSDPVDIVMYIIGSCIYILIRKNMRSQYSGLKGD